MRDVFSDHGFAQAVGADENQVATLADKVERERAVDQIAIDLLGPVPIEVGNDFESADTRELKTALKAAVMAVIGFHTNEFLQDHMGRPLRFGGARQKVVNGFGSGF
jgi:hypothetical protein